MHVAVSPTAIDARSQFRIGASGEILLSVIEKERTPTFPVFITLYVKIILSPALEKFWRSGVTFSRTLAAPGKIGGPQNDGARGIPTRLLGGTL